MQVNPIAIIYNDYVDKFGIPRQAGMVNNLSRIVFEKEFRDENAFRGIEEFSHLWLLWQSKEENYHLTVRPPRLGGNTRKGVFATRSPFRPNRICFSCVKLEEVKRTNEGIVLIVSGADILNGTPILDVKPYLPFSDCHPDARFGFAEEFEHYRLTVCPCEKLDKLDESTRQALTELLACDPRPAYQKDERIYKLDYGKYAVQFYVKDSTVFIENIKESKKTGQI